MTKEERKLQIEALTEERDLATIQYNVHRDKMRHFQNRLSELDRMIALYGYYLKEDEEK